MRRVRCLLQAATSMGKIWQSVAALPLLNLKWNNVCPVNYIIQSSSLFAAESCCQGLPECHRIQQVGTVPSLRIHGQKYVCLDNWDYRMKAMLRGPLAVSYCCWNLCSRPITDRLPLCSLPCVRHIVPNGYDGLVVTVKVGCTRPVSFWAKLCLISQEYETTKSSTWIVIEAIHWRL